MELFNCFARLLRDDSGATAIEYGLIAALIAVAAVVVMGTVGSNLTSVLPRSPPTCNHPCRAARGGAAGVLTGSP